MKAAVLLLSLAGSVAAQQAGIEGTVVDQTSGKPLERVHVRLTNASSSDGGAIPYGALSDFAGHFSVDGMKPGRYEVALERAGYVQTASRETYPYPNLTVKAGQHLADLKVEMARRVILAGRVVDEYGDPLPHTQVKMIVAPPTKLSPSVADSLDSATDDRGEFHILTGPGKYYLQAIPHRYATDGQPEVRSDGSTETVYAATYYPGVASKERATVVEAPAGSDIEGLEIRLTVSGVQQSLSVSGFLVGIPANTFGSVTLLPAEPSGFFVTPATHVTPEGKFAIAGLPPGVYDLTAQTEGTKGQLHGQTRIKLESSSLTDVQVALLPAIELTGALEMAGGMAAGIRTVRLEHADRTDLFGGGDVSADVARNGSFRIGNLWQGKFRVRVDTLPADSYVKKIEVDGAVAADGVVELASGQTPRLKITIATDGAEVAGSVLDKDGEPDTREGLNVYLLTEPNEFRLANAIEADDGKFRLRGIRPGKYRLFVLDPAQVGLAYDPATLEERARQLFAAAGEMEIRAGDRITKDLKLQEPDDVKKQ